MIIGDTPFFSKDLSILWIKNTKGTVGYVSSMFPNNTLLITIPGHITCSKPDKNTGIPTIYDTFDPRDREVESVWIVK
jgi:hypothetical protein